MKKSPYSFSEAQKICSEYQYLVGQRFEKDSDDVLINSIVISPFDQVNKKRFVIYYLLLNDAETALAHEYKGLLFDILIIASSKDDQDIFHEDIHAWLTRSKFAFEQNIETPTHAALPKQTIL